MMRYIKRGLLKALFTIAMTSSTLADQISVANYGELMHGAPYAVAMKKEFFKEAGVNIDGIFSSKGGGTTIRNIFGGGLPFGEVSLAAAVSAIQKGLEIKIVSGAVHTTHDTLWVTRLDENINSIQDLKGRKIGVTNPKSATEMLALMSLAAAGMSPKDVTIVSTGGVGAGLTALQKGAIDAAPMIEPIWTTIGSKYKPVFFIKDLLPDVMQSVGIATDKFVEEQPDVLKAILKGRLAGVKYIYSNPAEAAIIVSEAFKIDPAIAKTVIDKLIAINYWGDGSFDFARMNALVKGLQLMGEISEDVDWSKITDARFLPSEVKK